MAETVEKIALLILGWLFGMLSPAIVIGIQRRREVKALRATILQELNDVHYQVVYLVYFIDVNQGATTRGNMEWVRLHPSDYVSKDGAPKLLDAIRQMHSLNDEGISLQAQDGRAKTESTPAMKNCRTRILDSNFASFSFLDHKLQLIDGGSSLAQPTEPKRRRSIGPTSNSPTGTNLSNRIVIASTGMPSWR